MENIKDILSTQNQTQNQNPSLDPNNPQNLTQMGDPLESGKKIPSILVIEDEEIERYSLKSALETEGFFVEAVEKGFEAEAIVKNIFFDIVIVDYRLPDVDGVTLAKKLKTISPDFVSIFVTAHSSLEIALEAMRIGAYDYISKPLDIANLIKIIYKILEDKKELSNSKKTLNKLIDKKEIEYTVNNDKILVVSTPDNDVLLDINTKVGLLKRIRNFFGAIKNFYWG